MGRAACVLLASLASACSPFITTANPHFTNAGNAATAEADAARADVRSSPGAAGRADFFGSARRSLRA